MCIRDRPNASQVRSKLARTQTRDEFMENLEAYFDDVIKTHGSVIEIE